MPPLSTRASGTVFYATSALRRLAFPRKRGRVDGRLLAVLGRALPAAGIDAREEKHHRRPATLRQEHQRSAKSARRCRLSFNALLVAGGVDRCAMPFLRSPAHMARAASTFLLFALPFIVVSLPGDDRPRSSPPSMRFSAFRKSRSSGKPTNLIRKEKPDMDKPFGYDKLAAECEASADR